MTNRGSIGQGATRILAASVLCIGIGFTAASTASAEEMESAAARGGRLYDKWFKVIKAPKPQANHAAWPASNTKKKGDVTWRCKSCHGWDYKGRDGLYAGGSYKTGITGITALKGADPAKVIAILSDKTHGLAGMMDEQDLKDLAVFVTMGQVDMDQYFDRTTKAIKNGDAAKGSAYFNTICARCHGKSGNLPKDMPESLGAAASSNPWEVMHKIMNGAPAEQMPALRALDRQVILDVMAYVATLPKKM